MASFGNRLLGDGQKGAATRKSLIGLAAMFALALLQNGCWQVLQTGVFDGQGTCVEGRDIDGESKYEEVLGVWIPAARNQKLNWYACELPVSQVKSPPTGRLCPMGWKTGLQKADMSCYRAQCGWVTFDEAAEECGKLGASLVSINNADDNRFVQEVCGWESCWIGLSKRDDGRWSWQDNSSIGMPGHWTPGVYNQWEHGYQAEALRDAASAAFMNHWRYLDLPQPEPSRCASGRPQRSPQADGQWHDILQDYYLYHFICEQVGRGVCEGGWTAHKGSCYMRVCSKQKFYGAAKECNMRKAELVKISSESENQFVAELCGLNSCFIGLSEPPGSEEWKWMDGTSLGMKFEWHNYTNWAPGEPDNQYGDEDVAVINMSPREMYRMASEYSRSSNFYSVAGLPASFFLGFQLYLPVVLAMLTFIASRFDISCLSHALYVVVSATAYALGASAVAWLPYGGWMTLFSLLLIAQCVLFIITGTKLRELQWSTMTVWVPMGQARDFQQDPPGQGVAMRDLSATFAQA